MKHANSVRITEAVAVSVRITGAVPFPLALMYIANGATMYTPTQCAAAHLAYLRATGR